VCCVGIFYASVGEKIKEKLSLLSALTCVLDPMSLSRTSAPTKSDCLVLFDVSYLGLLFNAPFAS